MSEQVPSSFFEDAVIIFVPCASMGGKGYDRYMNYLRPKLKKEGINIGKISVCGFSAGGPDAISASGNDVKLIGLIDPNPVIPTSKLAKAKIIAAFNKNNWHDNSAQLKQSISKQFGDYAKWAISKGGNVEENTVQHIIFPKYFFYKYRNRLL